MNKCSKGGDTKNDLPDMTVSMGFCLCDQSCEPHRHFDWGDDVAPYDFVECMHDGETDHGHCPQAPVSFREDFDAHGIED